MTHVALAIHSPTIAVPAWLVSGVIFGVYLGMLTWFYRQTRRLTRECLDLLDMNRELTQLLGRCDPLVPLETRETIRDTVVRQTARLGRLGGRR